MGMGTESVSLGQSRSRALQTPVPLADGTFLSSTNFSAPTKGLTPAQHQGAPRLQDRLVWGGEWGPRVMVAMAQQRVSQASIPVHAVPGYPSDSHLAYLGLNFSICKTDAGDILLPLTS